jgi:hypothetical protein
MPSGFVAFPQNLGSGVRFPVLRSFIGPIRSRPRAASRRRPDAVIDPSGNASSAVTKNRRGASRATSRGATSFTMAKTHFARQGRLRTGQALSLGQRHPVTGMPAAVTSETVGDVGPRRRLWACRARRRQTEERSHPIHYAPKLLRRQKPGSADESLIGGPFGLPRPKHTPKAKCLRDLERTKADAFGQSGSETSEPSAGNLSCEVQAMR